jgi:hypothetical protein
MWTVKLIKVKGNVSVTEMPCIEFHQNVSKGLEG